MDSAEPHSRLSRISTAWTLVVQAHGEPPDERAIAQRKLIERYQEPIYRYLLGAVRDADVADELFQEFAVQFLRGGFRHADPQHGRFRDYLRTSLIHLISRHRRAKHPTQPIESFDPAAPQAPRDDEFVDIWRREMLAKTWAALAEYDRQSGQIYHAVLKFRAEHPDATAAQMAQQLTEQLNADRPFTETGIRKTLQRSRERFADLLLDEVARSLHDPTDEAVEQELIELRLLDYCRPAFDRRRESD